METIKLAATVTMVSTWDVELRPTPGHYHVYYQNSWNTPEWTRWGVIACPLDVREAAAALGDLDDDGLSGDWLRSIRITGLEGWQAEMLRMSAMTTESPYAAQLEFLVRLDDRDIEWIWRLNGSLTSEAGLATVTDLLILSGDDGLYAGPVELDVVLQEHGLGREATAGEIRAAADRLR